MRDQIVKARQEAEPHHIFPNSGWVSIFLRANEDVDRAIRLLERSFQLAAAHRKGKAERLARPRRGAVNSPEKLIDNYDVYYGRNFSFLRKAR